MAVHTMPCVRGHQIMTYMENQAYHLLLVVVEVCLFVFETGPHYVVQACLEYNI
jgi:hypothetical protein